MKGSISLGGASPTEGHRAPHLRVFPTCLPTAARRKHGALWNCLPGFSRTVARASFLRASCSRHHLSLSFPSPRATVPRPFFAAAFPQWGHAQRLLPLAVPSVWLRSAPPLTCWPRELVSETSDSSLPGLRSVALARESSPEKLRGSQQLSDSRPDSRAGSKGRLVVGHRWAAACLALVGCVRTPRRFHSVSKHPPVCVCLCARAPVTPFSPHKAALDSAVLRSELSCAVPIRLSDCFPHPTRSPPLLCPRAPFSFSRSACPLEGCSRAPRLYLPPLHPVLFFLPRGVPLRAPGAWQNCSWDTYAGRGSWRRQQQRCFRQRRGSSSRGRGLAVALSGPLLQASVEYPDRIEASARWRERRQGGPEAVQKVSLNFSARL